MLRQITRRGRLDALKRTADLLLELHDLLLMSGVAVGNSFQLALTQAMMGDTLGLTSVHINRALQILRRDSFLILAGGVAPLPDRAGLLSLVEFTTTRLTTS